MLIKSADDKSKRLALLQDLQQSPMLDARQKEWLRDELRRCKTGMDGERAAAFYLDGHYKDKRRRKSAVTLSQRIDGEWEEIALDAKGTRELLPTKVVGYGNAATCACRVARHNEENNLPMSEIKLFRLSSGNNTTRQGIAPDLENPSQAPNERLPGRSPRCRNSKEGIHA